MPVRTSTPASSADPTVTAPTVRTTCRAPPPNISGPIRLSWSPLSSSPIANSRKMTPTSASWSTSSVLSTTPSAYGPSRAPVARYPTIGIRPTRWHR